MQSQASPDTTTAFSEKKIQVLFKVLKVLMLVIGTMSVIRLIEQNFFQFSADIVFLVVLGITYQFMKNNIRYYKVLIRVAYFVSAVFAIFIMVYYPDNPVRFIWLSTVIYMIFYLFERKEALYWILVISILLDIAFLLDPGNFHIKLSDFLVWAMNVLIILIIAHWYATIEEESNLKFIETQKILTEEVQRKTKELRLLNENLESKIEEKIRKNAEQEKLLFRQARYAQMGEMLSMIAHQWRQPLNTISVTTATLQAHVEMDRYEKPLFQDKIKTISGSVEHLSATIDDFRNFFKPDKDKEEIPFSQIVQNALDLTLASMEKKHIIVKTTYQCDCCIFSYPNEIIHVVLNLIKNAEDALLAKDILQPEIIIHTYGKEDMAVMEIEDNAGGIEESIIEKIFDPYFTTKENSDGTGLGLYMSKIIIEDHCHGKIEMKNGEKGALFRLLLPSHQGSENCK
jgi:signal transduction histidine kinase